MGKYSYEFKKRVVQEYLDGKGGYGYLAEKYKVGNKDKKQVQRWIKAYQAFGDDGLMSSKKYKKYSFEFKMNVVELYLTSKMSYGELALHVGMNNPSMISTWVNNYRREGSDALQEKNKGRKSLMSKARKINAADTDSKYVKQLEDELLKLRIENAYLKELRRLRLEEEALNIRRELSVVSEEILN